MPIPIECESCHRQYKVDDKLAGKKVKCKGCGAPIGVPGTAPGEAEARDCLSCGAPIAPGNRVCTKCGFNMETGQKEMLLLADEADELKEKKKRRWTRQRGMPLLEQLDELLKLLVILGLIGGIVVTVVHIARSPGGFTLSALLPMGVVLAALGGIMAPLAGLAVNITVRTMKLAPRDDTYVRMMACVLLPFVVGMLTGWPEMAERWGFVSALGWLAAVGLLVYFFRAEVMEWVGSLVAAAVALSLSLIVVSLLGGAVNDLAGGLYGDMLPSGPWTGLAKGHSPEPKAPATAAVVTLVATQPVAPAAAPGTEEAPAVPAMAATQMALPAATVPTRPAVAIGPRTMPATAQQPVVVKMTSPYFAGVTDMPGIRDAAGVVVPVVPGDWMLTLKTTDTTAEVDRWSLNPLEKKEHSSYPLLPRKMPQFALSSKGDVMAVLSFFPRRQLDVVAFDSKTPKKTYVLDLPANIPEGATQAVPALVGIVDLAHYYVRWDLNGQSVLQAYGTTTGMAWRAAAIGPGVETCPAAFSPNGHTVAVFGRNQISFFNVDGSTSPKPIVVASDMVVRQLGMAFSSDSTQIGIYATVQDLPTVMVFQVRNGDPVCTALLSQVPLGRNAETMPHALLWLPGAQAWLVNGNDLLDGATGTKFGSLGLSGLAEPQIVGPSTVALTFKGEGSPRTILAKLDDEKIRAAKSK